MCNGEAVAYAEFVEAHPELRFVGLNVADTPDGRDAFLERYGWTWAQIDDPDRKLAGSLGIPLQPSVAVLDAGGEVVARFVGGGERDDWEALVAELG